MQTQVQLDEVGSWQLRTVNIQCVTDAICMCGVFAGTT